jgi:hypothetical protein
MQLRILKTFALKAGIQRASSFEGTLSFPDSAAPSSFRRRRSFSRLEPLSLEFLFRGTPQSGVFGRIQDGIANVAELCRR